MASLGRVGLVRQPLQCSQRRVGFTHCQQLFSIVICRLVVRLQAAKHHTIGKCILCGENTLHWTTEYGFVQTTKLQSTIWALPLTHMCQPLTHMCQPSPHMCQLESLLPHAPKQNDLIVFSTKPFQIRKSILVKKKSFPYSIRTVSHALQELQQNLALASVCMEASALLV